MRVPIFRAERTDSAKQGLKRLDFFNNKIYRSVLKRIICIVMDVAAPGLFCKQGQLLCNREKTFLIGGDEDLVVLDFY